MAGRPRSQSLGDGDASASHRVARTVSARLEPVHPALEDLDPSTSFLYRPHTVTALILGVLAVIHASSVFNPRRRPAEEDAAEAVAYANAKAGVIAVCLVFLSYSVLQGPRTALVRPHPAFWRLVHGVLLLYLLLLTFLLFQNVDDARQFLRHLYPELGVELDERAYGSDCRLFIPGTGVNWPVIKATVFDEFVIAHTLGWWGKALIMRNYPMLWVLSITFELLELTFQHMLPNFNECWWDSWILDVALCNFIGMVAGMATVRYFAAKEYNWRGISKQASLYDKLKRSVLQFTPYSFDNFDWRPTSSPARVLLCLIPGIMFLLFEVNAFFLKFILWVPPRNMLNSFRLLILFLGGIPAVKEYYEFIDAERDPFNKLGPSAWLALATAVAEVLVCVKHGRGMFPAPWPRTVVLAWGTFGGVFALALTGWAVHDYLLRRRSDGGRKHKAS